MDITLKDKNGVTLHTAKKHCKEDITVRVETQEISITPSVNEQIQEGLFNKVTVQGDEDLVAENIKKGKNIFGVEGGFDAVDTRDANATINDIAEGTTAYVNNQKIEGTVPNNGELQYEPSDEEQTIPAGITTGGAVKATDITKLNEYEACLTLANSIDNLDDYTDTTATAEDIRIGKTAYSNGEKITGAMEVSKHNATIDLSNITSGEAYKGITKIENLDMSTITNSNYMFNGWTNLTSISLKNTNNITNMLWTFKDCTSLVTAPEMDLSNATEIQNVFNGCSNLQNVPVYNLPKASVIYRVFYKCTALSDESLNNILMTCIKATSKQGTKSLKEMGLTEAQATKCTTLSNYQAFLDAGWTTGY